MIAEDLVHVQRNHALEFNLIFNTFHVNVGTRKLTLTVQITILINFKVNVVAVIIFISIPVKMDLAIAHSVSTTCHNTSLGITIVFLLLLLFLFFLLFLRIFFWIYIFFRIKPLSPSSSQPVPSILLFPIPLLFYSTWHLTQQCHISTQDQHYHDSSHHPRPRHH